MKSTTLRILTLCLFALAGSYALEKSLTDTGEDPPIRRVSRDRAPQQSSSALESKAAEIHKRIGISAAFDPSDTINPVTGKDIIDDLQEDGFIIPATLGEVEAALHAAALTPETEDDQAALELRHRGSYRFLSAQ